MTECESHWDRTDSFKHVKCELPQGHTWPSPTLHFASENINGEDIFFSWFDNGVLDKP